MTNEKVIKGFIDYMSIIKGRSTNTVNAYERDLGEFTEYLGGKDFTDATKADVEGFIKTLKIDKGNATSSANRKLSAVKSLYKYLMGNGDILNDPAAYVELSKLEKKVPKAITGDNLEKLLAALDKMCGDKKSNETSKKVRRRNRAIITLFLNCGLRKSELINLKVSDVDMDEGSILVNGKGAKQRLVYFNDKTRKAFNEYLELRNQFAGAEKSEYFFLPNSDEDKMSITAVNALVERLFRMAGLDDKGYVVHTLRKTSATLMFESGEDLRTIQEVLGHENIQTTTIYVGVSEERKKSAMTKDLF